MIGLVGYTGFVGSNIYACGKHYNEEVYDSKNIEEAYNTDSTEDMKLIYQS